MRKIHVKNRIRKYKTITTGKQWQDKNNSNVSLTNASVECQICSQKNVPNANHAVVKWEKANEKIDSKLKSIGTHVFIDY